MPAPTQVPGCQPFSGDRLIKLAAAMGEKAAVSSRQELYPRGMNAERALRLGIGALSGLGLGEQNEGFTVRKSTTGLAVVTPKRWLSRPIPRRWS